jgi:hypothetical protein
MNFEPLTPFDEITSGVPKPPIWLAAFEETEAQLLAACPNGVELLDVGRAAWACLPDEDAREEAFDALFYGWWETYQNLKARNAFSGGAA